MDKNKSRMILKAEVLRSADNDEDGILQASVASNATVDRYGDIVEPDGADLKNFKKNPQLLWSHNLTFSHSGAPIGKVVKTWFEGEGKKKALMFKAQFDMADEFAREIFRKYKDGFLNAFSIGFMPMEWEELGDWAYRFTKWELLEISAVPVPANPDAVVQVRGLNPAGASWSDIEKESMKFEKKDRPFLKKKTDGDTDVTHKDGEGDGDRADDPTPGTGPKEKVENNSGVSNDEIKNLLLKTLTVLGQIKADLKKKQDAAPTVTQEDFIKALSIVPDRIEKSIEKILSGKEVK